jgi:hypothetical protein
MNLKTKLAISIHGAMLVLSFFHLLHAFVGSFFVAGKDSDLQLSFLYIVWWAWFPLSVLGMFIRRTAAALMLICIPIGLHIDSQISHPHFTPRIERIWLTDSFLPLALSAVILRIMQMAHLNWRTSATPSTK